MSMDATHTSMGLLLPGALSKPNMQMQSSASLIPYGLLNRVFHAAAPAQWHHTSAAPPMAGIGPPRLAHGKSELAEQERDGEREGEGALLLSARKHRNELVLAERQSL